MATDFLQWSVLCLSLCCCDGFGEQGLGPGGGVGVGPDTSAGSGPSGVLPAPLSHSCLRTCSAERQPESLAPPPTPAGPRAAVVAREKQPADGLT